MRTAHERQLQTAGVNWLKMALPELLVIAIPNEQVAFGRTEEEQKTNMIRMKLMKDAGLYPGAADLILFKKTDLAKGLMWVRFLETKDKTPQSKNQKNFQQEVEDRNGIYAIWRSLPELDAIIRGWGLSPLCEIPVSTHRSKRLVTQNMIRAVNMEGAEERIAERKKMRGQASDNSEEVKHPLKDWFV